MWTKSWCARERHPHPRSKAKPHETEMGAEGGPRTPKDTLGGSEEPQPRGGRVACGRGHGPQNHACVDRSPPDASASVGPSAAEVASDKPEGLTE